MEEAVSLQELFKIIKKRFVLIISILFIVMSIAGVVSYYYLTPIYQASTQILINQKESDQNQFNSQAIDTNLQLINTYNVIIKSPVILSKVINNLNLKTTPDLLYKQINVNSEQNSQVVNVSVQDSDLQQAIDIANMTAKVFQEEIKTLMNVDNVNILSLAVYTKDTQPVKPNSILNVAIAGIIGLMIGIGITFLMEYLNTTIKTEQDIEELLALPILGLISPISPKFLKKSQESKSPNKKRRAKNLV
ncbi:Capsular polysaccharide biosynthesis protein [Psychrobacillus sp. OK028]|uniref:YveK family protein n=1 Tax=Psychrobacillus sp. OK028 TaxID=1884359 RepID=UPI000881635B|nr:Wzz/FepE/Etk N-terminal domain-containing protein [Psychrobacillus sp. OK028]SDO01045.1 Capsular polysaccharide biosynthesis protein [Psychrobacillus sp. OK028]